MSDNTDSLDFMKNILSLLLSLRDSDPLFGAAAPHAEEMLALQEEYQRLDPHKDRARQREIDIRYSDLAPKLEPAMRLLNTYVEEGLRAKLEAGEELPPELLHALKQAGGAPQAKTTAKPAAANPAAGMDYEQLWLRKRKLEREIPKTETKLRQMRAELTAIEGRIKEEDEEYAALRAKRQQWLREGTGGNA